jgi:tyrosine-protein kinase Etk/Wzc
MEQEKSQLVGVRKLGGAQLAQLTQLYEKESELSRLEAERDLTRKIYTDIATSYERARLNVAGRSSEIEIIAPAIQPDRPVSRNVARNAVIALIAGLLISALGVLIYGAVSAAQQQASL